MVCSFQRYSPTPRWTICWATMALHWKRLTRQTGNDNAVGLTLMTKSKNCIEPRKMTSHHMTPHPSFFLFYALLRDNSWLSSWGNHSHLTIQAGARFPSIECWSDISRHTKSCHLKHLLSSLFLVQLFAIMIVRRQHLVGNHFLPNGNVLPKCLVVVVDSGIKGPKSRLDTPGFAKTAGFRSDLGTATTTLWGFVWKRCGWKNKQRNEGRDVLNWKTSE